MKAKLIQDKDGLKIFVIVFDKNDEERRTQLQDVADDQQKLQVWPLRRLLGR